MKYHCCFKDGRLIDSLPEREEPSAAVRRDFEVIQSPDLSPQESDWLVAVGEYEIPAHRIDPGLVTDSETYLDG